MKKILLSTLIFISIISTLKAQIYTPNGTIQGNSGNNNVGIGTNASNNSKLEILEATESKPNGQVAATKSILKLSRNGTNNYSYNENAEFRIGHGGDYVYGSKLDLYIDGASNTNNIPDQHVMTWNFNGNVGIGTTNPSAKLEIYSSTPGITSFKAVGVNGSILIDNVGSGENYYNASSFQEFQIGGTPKMRINSNGLIGIGTINPRAYFDIGKDISGGQLGTVFGRLPEGDGTGLGTYLGVKGYATQGSDPYAVKSFSIVHDFYGQTNSSINFYRGGGMLGGYMTFSTSDNTEKMRIGTNGYVGIGSTNPDSKLTVKGKIHAEEVKIDLAIPADYVFEKYYLGESSLKPDYTLLTLSEVEKFTAANHHLPNVPSAKEIKENGLLLGEMSNMLLQKIEELTLYSIDQKKEIEKLKEENKSVKNLEERLNRLEKELETKN